MEIKKFIPIKKNKISLNKYDIKKDDETAEKKRKERNKLKID